MSFEDRADRQGAQRGVLPGAPVPYFLEPGEGEHARLFGDLFTVLLSADETDGQFGVFTSTCPAGDLIPTHVHADTHEIFYVLEGSVRVHVQDRDGTTSSRLLRTGGFGYVPAGFAHAYRVETAARVLGVASGGFERFFGAMGLPVESATLDQPPFVPDFPRMQAAAQRHRTQFLPEFVWPEPDAGSDAPGA